MVDSELRRQQLCNLIDQWNVNRLDMFTVSSPDENMEFHGVVRFFLPEAPESYGQCATKCLRVSSTASAGQMIGALVGKFHATKRVFAQESDYTLWEQYESKDGAVEERCLNPSERVLLVQLGWPNHGREGRFVLRHRQLPKQEIVSPMDFVRNAPKRFSKNQGNSIKRRWKPQQKRDNSHTYDSVPSPTCTPQTTFARTLSNPELVLKRRREQKFGNQLVKIGEGGALKIYGVELFPQRPYVTLIVSPSDTACQIVQKALEKYGLDDANPNAYILVQIFLLESESTSRSYNDLRGIGKQHERSLHDTEQPLRLLAEHPTDNVVFFLRRRANDIASSIRPSSTSATTSTMCKSYTLDSFFPPLRFSDKQRFYYSKTSDGRRSSPPHSRHPSMIEQILASECGGDEGDSDHNEMHASQLPCLVPINTFASTANFGAGAVAIQPGVTEIGSSSACAIQLRAPSVLPRHCCLVYYPGSGVTVSLLDKSALLELNGASIHSTTVLYDGVHLRIGGVYCYRFFSAAMDGHQMKQQQQQNKYSSISRQPFNPICHQTHRSESDLRIQNISSQSPSSTSTIVVSTVEDPPIASSTPSKITMTTAHHNGNGFHNYQRHQKQQCSFDGQTSLNTSSPIQHKQPSSSLPILIECLNQDCENELFRAELFGVLSSTPTESGTQQMLLSQRFGSFGLTPAFILYALCRHRITQKLTGDLQQRLLSNTFAKFIDCCSRRVKVNLSHRETFLFWLSNASELLNMGCSDVALSNAVGPTLLGELAQLVQNVFTLLVEKCRQQVFNDGIHPMICRWINGAFTISTSTMPAGGEPLIASLDECLRIVRWALLNPALTIQLFSHLFHFISATIFNWLTTTPEAHPLISHQFGLHLKQLLDEVQKWAEQRGLELAAECHMDRLQQTVNLLITPKNLEQIVALGATCYRLNSVQVRFLLEHYIGDIRTGEAPTVSREIIEHIVALACQQADQIGQKPNQPQLTESNILQLPFLIPHDGYIIEKLRGIPPDMAAFVNALQQRGLIRVFVQHPSTQKCSSFSEMPWNVHITKFQSNGSRLPRLWSSTSSAKLSRNSTAASTTMFPSSPITMAPPLIPPHKLGTNDDEMPLYAEIQRRDVDQKRAPVRCQSATLFGSTPNSGTQNYELSNSATMPQPTNNQQKQWNERLIDAEGTKQLLVERITLKRRPNNESIGLSIVEVETPEQGSAIYVKNVIANSSADIDARMETGDQLLSVNGQSLIGVGQDVAAQKIVSSGPVVHFEVAKGAAQANGLGPFFQQQNVQANVHQQTTQVASPQHVNVQGTPIESESSALVVHPLTVHQLKQRPSSTSELGNHANTGAYTTAGSGPLITPSHAMPSLLHHSQPSSSASSSLSSSRLPSHYRPSANRSQVVVLQPTRPTAPMALPLHVKRNNQNHNDYIQPNSPSPLLIQENHHRMEHKPQSKILNDYGQLPLITNINASSGSPPINSSTTCSTSTTATIEERDPNDSHEWNGMKQRKQPTTEQIEVGDNENVNGSQSLLLPSKSGRNSAPLFFGSDIQQQIPGIPSKYEQHPATKQVMPMPTLHTMTAEEVERELDRLESIVGVAQRTEEEETDESQQWRYRQLLERLRTIRKNAATEEKTNNGGTKLPLAMVAAAQQLERQSKSLAALSLDPGIRASSLTPSAYSAGNLLKIKRVNAPISAASAVLAELQSRNEQKNEDAMKKQPPLIPAKPAIREKLQRSTAEFVESINKKKRVQFSVQNNENISLEEPSDTDEDVEVADDDNGSLEPRVQIIGAQEVYVNDPRQRRLQELQANQKVLKPIVDSSSLGFREKMRIFAEQLGEKEPPVASNQHKSSSAERRIIQLQNEEKNDVMK